MRRRRIISRLIVLSGRVVTRLVPLRGRCIARLLPGRNDWPMQIERRPAVSAGVALRCMVHSIGCGNSRARAVIYDRTMILYWSMILGTVILC